MKEARNNRIEDFELYRSCEYHIFVDVAGRQKFCHVFDAKNVKLRRVLGYKTQSASAPAVQSFAVSVIGRLSWIELIIEFILKAISDGLNDG